MVEQFMNGEDYLRVHLLYFSEKVKNESLTPKSFGHYL